MYVEPTSRLAILRNCPLDNTYDHTLWFATPEDQFNYFVNLAKFPFFTKLTYQRVNKGKIRIEKNVVDLYDCNYIMFENERFGTNKWFFAFITSVEYVNEVTSEITYQIDVMQTWYWSYTLGQCFVEREHVTDDTIGAHTVPENLETGPFITTASSGRYVYDLSVYVMATEVADGAEAYFEEPTVRGGMVQPCWIAYCGRVTEQTTTQTIHTITDTFARAGKSNAIVAMFTAPSNYVSGDEHVRTEDLEIANQTLSNSVKNNKLFVYPYCSLELRGGAQSIILRYELFNSNTRNIRIWGSFGAKPVIVARPTQYSGNIYDRDHTISISGFPLCPWISDYYQNWLAQNKMSMMVSTGATIANAVVGVGLSAAQGAGTGGAYGAILGGVTSAISGLTNIGTQVARNMATTYEHEIIPDTLAGSVDAVDVDAISGNLFVETLCRTMTPEYTKMIDDYFTMFGYKINTLKVPNIHARAHWTYTKTVACVVHGSVPADDMSAICQIYDHGITFWTNGDEVGDYSLDNYII